MSTSSAIEDYGPILSGISYGFLIPTTLVYIWRMASKFSLHSARYGLHWDDLFLTCCWVFAVCGTSFGLISVHYGFGKHWIDISLENRPHAMFYFWIYQIEYKFQVMFAKLVMLCFYCRVFRTDEGFYIRTLCFMGFVVTASIGFIFANIFSCTPINRAWNRTIAGTCINNEAYWVSHAIFHILTDVIIFFMPVLPVIKLKMDARKKIAVTGAFALGSIVCIADGVRIHYLQVSAKSTTDATYGGGPAVILTTVVSLTSIMCICLVTGLRRSIITCCHTIRQTGATKRSAYQLSDVEATQGTRSGQDAWQQKSHTVIGKTESEESFVMTDDKAGSRSNGIMKNVSYTVQTSRA